MLAGIGSAVFLSNIYDLKNERLLLERKELSYDIKTFKNRKDSLISTINSLTVNLNTLKDSISNLKEAINKAISNNVNLQKNNAIYKNNYDSLTIVASSINDSIANLTISFLNMKWLVARRDSQIVDLFKKLELEKSNNENLKKQTLDELRDVLNLEQIGSNFVLSVYPNPATDFININLGNSNQETLVIVSLCDISGKEVKTYNFIGSKSPALKLPELSSGLYLVKITIGENQYIQKLIIKS